MQRHIRFQLQFQQGYIAHPYWPEREEVINIQKISGMNRAKSEKTRSAALTEYLKRTGWTEALYADLRHRAERAWYRAENDDETSEILIPSHQLYGCLIEATKRCPATLRPCESDNLRHVIALSDCHTGKYTADGIFKRLVMPKSGTGQPLSNQRALRENPFIAQFTAAGTLRFFPDDLRDKGDFLEDFLIYAGQRCGVGASRKMGYGRFVVAEYRGMTSDGKDIL
jgi:hypothetical protein